MKLLRLIVFCIVWLHAHYLQGQQIMQSYFGNKAHYEIDFRYKQGFILVQIQLSGILPLQFIVDTGSSHTLLFDKFIAQVLGIELEPKRIKIRGADYSEDILAYVARNVPVKLGSSPIRYRDIIILDHDFEQLSYVIGERVDGIIGGEFFKNTILKIDYRKQKLNIYNPNKYKPKRQKDFFTLPLHIKQNKCYVRLHAGITETNKDSLDLLIDTGASLSLLLYAGYNTDIPLPKYCIPGQLGVGLGGSIDGYLGRIPFLAFGDYVFGNLITNFQQRQPIQDSVYLHSIRDGIIGSLLLDRFTIIINYVTGQLAMRAERSWDREIKVDRSGLRVVAFGPGFNQFVIQEVVPNSPAQEADIRRGDVITRIACLPVWFLDLQTINNKLMGKVGKKFTLTIRRNGLTMKKTIVLRDLI